MYVKNSRFLQSCSGIEQGVEQDIEQDIQQNFAKLSWNLAEAFKVSSVLSSIGGSMVVLASFLGLLVAESFASPLELDQPPSVTSVNALESDSDLLSEQSDSTVFRDGVYLYGQTPNPEAIGQAYLVFESRNDHLLGAFYMPHSSFDCFYGTAKPERLKLTIVESYTQKPYAYSVALATREPLAALGMLALPATLQGFHHILDVSENDQRLLNTCRSEYQDAIWN